jgi:hypothetical protein
VKFVTQSTIALETSSSVAAHLFDLAAAAGARARTLCGITLPIFLDVKFPTRYDASFSIFKDFALTERAKVQFRSEMINSFQSPLVCRSRDYVSDLVEPGAAESDPTKPSSHDPHAAQDCFLVRQGNGCYPMSHLYRTTPLLILALLVSPAPRAQQITLSEGVRAAACLSQSQA